MSDTDDPNVNSDANVPSEVNVKRLGEQQKEVLRYLYSRRGQMKKQVDVIRKLYGEVTDSRKASMSRSFSKLKEADLIFERKAHYSETFDAYVSHRVNYQLTDEGEQFLENDDRFPEIAPTDDECIECGDAAETYPEGEPYCWPCHESKMMEEVQERVYGS